MSNPWDTELLKVKESVVFFFASLEPGYMLGAKERHCPDPKICLYFLWTLKAIPKDFVMLHTYCVPSTLNLCCLI